MEANSFQWVYMANQTADHSLRLAVPNQSISVEIQE